MTNPLDREYPDMIPDKLPETGPSEEIMQLVADLNYAYEHLIGEPFELNTIDKAYMAQNLVLEAAKVQIVNQTVFTPDNGVSDAQ